MAEEADAASRRLTANLVVFDAPSEALMPDQSKAKRGPQVMAALAAGLAALVCGGHLGYTNQAWQDMINNPDGFLADFTEYYQGLAGSMMPVGALIGTFLGGPVVEHLGRRKALIFVSGPALLISWVVIGLAQSMTMLILGRFLAGLAVGISLLVCPVYISEIATVDWRGTFGTCTQLGIVFGILLSYVLGALVNWRWLAFSFTPFCIVMIVLMFFMPESPPWLLLKRDDRNGARSALVKLRGPAYLVDRELDFINYEAQRSSGRDAQAKLAFKEFLKPLNLVPTLVAWLLMWNQQTSGINVVIFYSTQIFEAAGGSISSFASTVIMGVVQVQATILASFLIDRAGRRILLIASSGLMLVAMAALTAYFTNEESAKASGLTMIPIAAVCLFIAAFSIGYGPVPWLLITEILPHRVRALATSSSLVINWGLATIITFAFPPMARALGAGTSFMIFTILCTIGFVTTVIFSPETKKMTLSEIEPFWRRRCPCFFNDDVRVVSERETEQMGGSSATRGSGEAG